MSRTWHWHIVRRRRPRCVPAGVPVPVMIFCSWCGAPHIDDPAAPVHATHPCGVCGWSNTPYDFATTGVDRASLEWCGRGSPWPRVIGIRDIPPSVRAFQSWHPWPDQRREHRERKRLGSRLRRRLNKRLTRRLWCESLEQ